MTTSAHPSLRAVLAARNALGGHPEADRFVMWSLTGKVTKARGLPWPRWRHGESWPNAASRYGSAAILQDIDVTGWDMADLGTARECLLSGEKRAAAGAWYTPPEAAEAMCRLSIGPQLERLAKSDDPGDVLMVTSVDPACGTGVFLVAAARLITAAYCQREFGSARPETTGAVMAEVMQSCVYGMDIDGVAVDLARFALWMECGGRPEFGFMDENVCVVNPLSAPDSVPPALARRDPKWAR
jgi:hypothetical protein